MVLWIQLPNNLLKQEETLMWWIQRRMNEPSEDKNERDTNSDNKPTGEHDRPETPDRKHDRKSRERDREKERELERYERDRKEIKILSENHRDRDRSEDQGPKTKEELFSYEIDSAVYDKHQLHDRGFQRKSKIFWGRRKYIDRLYCFKYTRTCESISNARASSDHFR